jgi:hypothetical protein
MFPNIDPRVLEPALKSVPVFQPPVIVVYKGLAPGETLGVLDCLGRGVLHSVVAVFSSYYDAQLVLRITIDGKPSDYSPQLIHEKFGLGPRAVCAPICAHFLDRANYRFGFYIRVPRYFSDRLKVEVVNLDDEVPFEVRSLEVEYGVFNV